MASWLKEKSDQSKKWLAERAEKRHIAAEAEAEAKAKKEAACNLLPTQLQAMQEKYANLPDGPLKHNKYMNACQTAKDCGDKSAVEVLKEYAGKDGNLGVCVAVGGRKKKRKSRRRKTKKRRKTKRKSRRRKSRKTKRRRRRRRKSRR